MNFKACGHAWQNRRRRSRGEEPLPRAVYAGAGWNAPRYFANLLDHVGLVDCRRVGMAQRVGQLHSGLQHSVQYRFFKVWTRLSLAWGTASSLASDEQAD